MIALIDYGMGNISSIINMFKRIEVRNVVLTNNPEILLKADKIILPGVGAFDNGMNNLEQRGIIPLLNSLALEKKIPFLGICLGMQLLTKGSEEGVKPGLGWIDARAKKFSFDNTSDLKIPHMGWNYVHVRKPNALIPQDNLKRKYYFVHSYYVQCSNSKDVVATTEYGLEFDSMIGNDNIFGAQFHPEKSHRFGMEILSNFAKL